MWGGLNQRCLDRGRLGLLPPHPGDSQGSSLEPVSYYLRSAGSSLPRRMHSYRNGPSDLATALTLPASFANDVAVANPEGIRSRRRQVRLATMRASTLLSQTERGL